ncbi:MAG: alpha/beta fold hydrolase [Pseudomonadota bacterium]
MAERLYRIKARTAVVQGASDRLVPPPYGEAFAAAIPGARLVIVPEAGHMVVVEKPEAVVEAVAGLGEIASLPFAWGGTDGEAVRVGKSCETRDLADDPDFPTPAFQADPPHANGREAFPPKSAFPVPPNRARAPWRVGSCRRGCGGGRGRNRGCGGP